MTDTPAPIATPEETGKRIALSGGSITLPFDIESEERPVGVRFPSRKKLAAQIAEAIRAALASSNAEIERVKAAASGWETTANEAWAARRACEAQVAALTDQVGRMREALPMVRALLRVVWQSFDSGGESMRSKRSQALEAAQMLLRATAPDDGIPATYAECDDDPWAYISRARLAALSPTEPEAMEK